MTHISKANYDEVKDQLIQVSPDEIPQQYWNELHDLCAQILVLPFTKENMYSMQAAINDMTEFYIEKDMINFNIYFMISANLDSGIVEIKAHRLQDEHPQ